MAIQTKGVRANPPTLIEDAWVKSYEIGYSVDGVEWNLYQDKYGKNKVMKEIAILNLCHKNFLHHKIFLI